MLTIRAVNVNDALPLAMLHLADAGKLVQCRPNIGGSAVIEYPSPVCTEYARPRERVLFDPIRDANPYFHFFEALWILAGRRDVKFLERFNRRIAAVSDYGVVFHGAYGYRLRNQFEDDQIETTVKLLANDKLSRRAVLQIWDSIHDAGSASKDVPCNDLVMLKVRNYADGPALDITVCCRSNDIVWGAYGANVVQFSMLQEYIAARIGVNVGTYRQVSDSFHVYADNPFWQQYRSEQPKGGLWGRVDQYSIHDNVAPYPLFAQPVEFDYDLAVFFSAFDNGISPLQAAYQSATFKDVVLPMYESHTLYLGKQYQTAMGSIDRCAATDWRMGCGMWLARRFMRAEAARLARPQVQGV